MLFADFKKRLLGEQIFVMPGTIAVAQTTVCDPTGDPDNEVVCLAWTDAQGLPCSVTLTEAGISNGVITANQFVGADHDGDTLTIGFTPPIGGNEAAVTNLLPAMQVSLDGGVTYLPAPEGVQLVINRVNIPGEDGLGQLHVNATPERLIFDVWTTRDEPLDHNIGTSCQQVEDLVCGMVFEAA